MRPQRWTTWLAAGAMALGILTAAFAQTDPRSIREGVWNDSLTAALTVARYTGRPVLVFFHEDWCGYCEQLEKVLVHPDVKEATKRFILVKLNLDVHRAFARQHKIDMHHQLLMLGWSGQPIGKVTEFTSDRDVALKVIEAAAANDLSAGDKLTELGYYNKAAERFRIVVRIARDERVVESARKALEHIAEKAKQQLDLIRQLVRAGRLDEAADACTTFLADFPPDMGKAEVEKILGQLRSGKPALPADAKPPADGPKPTRADEAKQLLEQGMVHEWDKRFCDAVTNYEKLAKDYAETPSAAEAKTRLDLLLKDPEMRELIARQTVEKYCTRWFQMAELYEKNGLDDMAVKYYNTIITVYPESRYAAEARRRLAEIERRRPKPEK